MNKVHELLFLNPELREGINVTVRKGDKWIHQAEVGDGVGIYKTDVVSPSNRIRSGVIVALAYLPCNMIPIEWLGFEHDPLCDNQLGLCTAMRRAYDNFEPDSLVTVIMFLV